MKHVTALKLATSLLLCGSTLSVAVDASAQEAAVDVSRNSTVMSRPRPAYDPLGIRVRSFFIYPSLSVGGQYDSNINATPNNTNSDFGIITTPQINIVSNWTRHSLGLTLGAQQASWVNYSRNNYLDLNGTMNGTLDITRNDALSGSLGVARGHEARSSPDASQNMRDLTKVFTANGGLSYRHDFNKIFTIVGADAIRTGYDNPQVSQIYRNRWTYRTNARVGYNISPRLDAFVDGSYHWIRYDNVPPGIVDRNAEGFKVAVGTDIDITGLVFGSVQLGYTKETYDDSSLDSAQGLGGGGTITWNVTQLDTLVFNASGEIVPTTVTYQGDTASSDFQKSATVNWSHELLRNVLTNANAGYVRDDFTGTSRTDNTFLAGAGVTYLINRNFSLDATYSFTKRNSDDSNEEYTDNVIFFGLTAKL